MWRNHQVNRCVCGHARFTTEKPTVFETPDYVTWALTEGERQFLKSLNISPD